jgi:4'-phosphopantetheinyl transferase
MWQPFKKVVLNKNQIMVVYFSLNEVDTESFYYDLSTAEQTRAKKLINVTVYKQFVVARGLLRKLLSEQLACSTSKLDIAISHKGKPYLSNFDFQFNISHTHSAIALALSPNLLLGVDVESLERQVDIHAVAKQVFSEQERYYLEQQSDATEAFIKIWTRKEALVKAQGDGLYNDLKMLSVVPDYVTDGQQNKMWYLQSLPKINQHHVACASAEQPEKQFLLEIKF